MDPDPDLISGPITSGAISDSDPDLTSVPITPGAISDSDPDLTSVPITSDAISDPVNIPTPPPPKSLDVFFEDGERRIDYVLVFPKLSVDADEDAKKTEEAHDIRRRGFLQTLVDSRGLEIEQVESADGDTNFVKIHIPFSVLRLRAEMLRIKMPIGDELIGKQQKLVREEEEDNRIRQNSDAFHETRDNIPMVSIEKNGKGPDKIERVIERKNTIQFDDGEEDEVPSQIQIALQSVWNKLYKPFRVDPLLVPEEPPAFTCKFVREREDVFQIDDEDSFFSPTQRSRIVHYILSRTPFPAVGPEKVDGGGIGIDALLAKGTFVDAFPLHDGEEEDEKTKCGGCKSTEGADDQNQEDYSDICDRRRLYLSWGRFSQFYKEQPLNLIRRYFGEKIAIYFAWLGFYTMMLIPVAILGVFATLYGMINVQGDPNVAEICGNSKNPGGFVVNGTFIAIENLTMCPLCRQPYCDYWKMSSSCDYTTVTSAMDNDFTVFFAFVMSVWTVVFLEFWKRKQAELSFFWDTEDLDDDEIVRADYEAKCYQKKKNPVSGILEPIFPKWKRVPRYMTSVCVVLLAVGCILVAIVGVIAYRGAVSVALYRWNMDENEELPGVDILKEKAKTNSKVIVSISAAMINLIIIMVLNKLYYFLALKLTAMETQRTDKDYEDSFTVKMFCFQFFNFYASIFYIAFFKGRFYGLFDNDDDHRRTSPARYDQCDPAGCFIELTIQMVIIMVGKQIFSNIQEFLIPRIKTFFQERQAKEVGAATAGSDEEKAEKILKLQRSISISDLPRWEKDFALVKNEELGLFSEYLEMVIQFGFVSLFVAAFPLAPFFALLNNVIEIRLDANKFTCSLRRQRPMRVKNIGAWSGILSTLAYFAVVVNALVIAFTSNFVDRYAYKLTASLDGSLSGFAKFTLSQFSVEDFSPGVNGTRPKGNWTPPDDICFYRDYRADKDQDYERTKVWYLVMLGKVAFVLIFEHVIMALRDVIAWVVPDVPRSVALSIKKEAYWVQRAIYGRELAEEAHKTKKTT